MFKLYLEKGNSKIDKVGVFTTIDIPSNMPILELTGDITSKNELKDINNSMNLQIGFDLYLSASGQIDDYLNHSCNPNCLIHIIGKRALLYSIYLIKAGTELVFDYSTTSTDNLSMKCNCKFHNCRKIINDYYYLDEEIVQEYKNKGAIPLFLMHPRLFAL